LKVSDTSYNLTKQLTKSLQLLWNIDRYIEDSEKELDAESTELWKQMKKDTERHAKMIRDRINALVAAGTF
jgi:hypothetical protein